MPRASDSSGDRLAAAADGDRQQQQDGEGEEAEGEAHAGEDSSQLGHYAP